MKYVQLLRFGSIVAGLAFMVGCGDDGSSSGGGTGGGSSGTGGAGTGGATTGGGGGTGGTPAGGTGGTPAGGTGGGTGGTPVGGTGGGTGGEPAGGTGGTPAGGTGGEPAGGTGGSPDGGTGGVVTGGTGGSGGTIEPVVWPSAECQAQTEALLGQMTKAQKAFQMTMPQYSDVNPAGVTADLPGAVFGGGGATPPGQPATPEGWMNANESYQNAALSSSLGIPVLLGIDAVHGHNTPRGTVIFPHNIGMGCTRNIALAEMVGEVTGKELAGTGFNWTFGPMLSVAWDDRWGRTYETFAEDPVLAGDMGAAVIRGMQGRTGLGTAGWSVIACAKHFAGDGQTTYGTGWNTLDRGNAQIDEATMLEFGVGPYEQPILSGLGSVMVSDASWNGEYMTEHSHLMRDILKGDLAFQGFVSTDWNAGGAVTASAAGADIFMHPGAWRNDQSQINSNASDAVVDDAVRRILNAKCEAGLWDWQRDNTLLAEVGSAAHREIGRQAVRESMVLLANDSNALPLAKGSNVFVTGSGGNDIGRQCGGWTITWQGASGNTTDGTTIQQAIGAQANVVGSAAEADKVVVVLSESPYAEFQGDSTTVNTLPSSDFQALSDARASGKPVIAIVMSGRPVQIESALGNADAWIAAFLPGTEGTGVADVLFGDFEFTGRLSHSWPHGDGDCNVNYYDAGYNPLFPYDYGCTIAGGCP